MPRQKVFWGVLLLGQRDFSDLATWFKMFLQALLRDSFREPLDEYSEPQSMLSVSMAVILEASQKNCPPSVAARNSCLACSFLARAAFFAAAFFFTFSSAALEVYHFTLLGRLRVAFYFQLHQQTGGRPP